MKVWRLFIGRNNMNINTVDERFPIEDFRGMPFNEWSSVEFKATKKGKNQDYVYLSGGIPVFSERVLQALNGLLADKVQLLDMQIINNNMDHKLVNVINVVDAIDYSRSVPERSFSGIIVDFKKMNFLAEKVESQHIFKIPEFPISTVYVSDKFKETVEASKLKGFEFIEAWDSERTDEVVQAELERYQNFLSEIEQKKGQEFDWSAAIQRIEKGKTVASGEWKMMHDEDGVLQIYKLSMDCKYSRLKSDFIPPILLGLKWHEIESDNESE